VSKKIGIAGEAPDDERDHSGVGVVIPGCRATTDLKNLGAGVRRGAARGLRALEVYPQGFVSPERLPAKTHQGSVDVHDQTDCRCVFHDQSGMGRRLTTELHPHSVIPTDKGPRQVAGRRDANGECCFGRDDLLGAGRAGW